MSQEKVKSFQRINVTSKAVRRIEPSEVAKALGAKEVTPEEIRKTMKVRKIP